MGRCLSRRRCATATRRTPATWRCCSLRLPEQNERWLEPLLDGSIRSAFCMTEPDVASSDATNMRATAMVEGDEVVVNGRKWWSAGVGHPNCKALIFMGLTDPDADRYHQHSMVLVPLDTPGVKVERMLQRWGSSTHPQARRDVLQRRTPARQCLIGGHGQAFAIAQARLGRAHPPLHATDRTRRAGAGDACRRATGGSRSASRWRTSAATVSALPTRASRSTRRVCTLHAAWLVDEQAPEALGAASQIKVAVPNMAQAVIDMAIQFHGGAGLSNDLPLAGAWTAARSLRLADGPDEVHRGVIARLELARYGKGKWST